MKITPRIGLVVKTPKKNKEHDAIKMIISIGQWGSKRGFTFLFRSVKIRESLDSFRFVLVFGRLFNTFSAFLLCKVLKYSVMSFFSSSIFSKNSRPPGWRNTYSEQSYSVSLYTKRNSFYSLLSVALISFTYWVYDYFALIEYIALNYLCFPSPLYSNINALGWPIYFLYT